MGLRSWFRLVTAAVATGGHYLAVEAGSLALVRWPRRREAWRSAVLASWGKSVGRILGLKVERRGPLPAPPFLLVANHLSYMDVLLLGGAVGGTFVAKSEIRRWPLFGRACYAAGVIFVDREARRDVQRVETLIRTAWQHGRGVILFPEATTSEGRQVMPLKPALLQGAALLGLPVHYATLRYRTPAGAEAAERSVCWVGGEPFRSHLPRLLALPEIHATLTFGPAAVAGGERKDLARRLHAAMSAIFEPTARG
jgi:1-acyl-sn-glycerol-3-phosphate acyltransferase